MTHRPLFLGVSLILSFALISVACNAPLPEPTPEVAEAPTATATATETPRPTATGLPTFAPTVTSEPIDPLEPTPLPDQGFYRNPELGFFFFYPSAWDVETTGGDFPAAIIYDNDDPVQLFVGAQLLAEEVTLEEFAADLGRTFAISGTTVLANELISLTDGTPARDVTFAWTPEGDENEFNARAIAAVSNGKGYALLLIARPDVLATRENTFQTIAAGLTLEQPELFGVSRTDSFVRLVDSPQTLDPALSTADSGDVIGHLFSGLVRLDANLQVVGDLADAWEVTDGGTRYIFVLKPDLTFHDGSPLTAEHVKLSWERALDPELGSATAPLVLGDITELEVVDEQTLAVQVDEPKPYFLQKLTQPAAFVVDLENTASGTDNTPWWKRPNGSGPFSLRRWAEGEVILLDAYPDYPEPATVPTLIYLPFGRIGLSLFEANIADVVEVSYFNAERVRNPADPLSDSLTETPLFCTVQVLLDWDGALSDSAVREALYSAVDEDLLADIVANGVVDPARSILMPGFPGYAAEFAKGDPVVDGVSLPDTLNLSVGGQGQVDPIVEAIVDLWRTELGIEVTVNQQAIPDLEMSIQAGEFGDMALWEVCAPYPDPYSLLDTQFHSGSVGNPTGYANSEVDQLLESARTEPDPAVRITLYQEAERLIMADLPVVPLVHPRQLTLVRSDLSGYVQPPISVLWPQQAEVDRE